MDRDRNYAKELDKIIAGWKEMDEAGDAERNEKSGELPGRKLLLHSCCAPCSSYVLEYLREYFLITVFYYNPNITEDEEYRKRVEEQKRLIDEYNRQVEEADFKDMHSTANAKRIEVIEGDYEPNCFFTSVKGLEKCPEGGERCFKCYELRLEKTARLAAEQGFDYFTTTLTISPLKNARKLNEIGERLGEKYGVFFLPSDFKKKEGYKRSIDLSKQFGLYRQNYCGCIYSKGNGEKGMAKNKECSCIVCERIALIKKGENPYFVRELETGYVVLGDRQRFKGYTLFLCKEHASEIHFLEKEFRNKFLQEMSLAAEAVYHAFEPDKLNYELLGTGNGVHMHWHFFPRREGDTPRPGPVWRLDKAEMNHERYVPAKDELEEMKRKLKEELDKLL